MAGRVIGTATVEVKADTSGFSSALSGLTSSFGSMRNKLQGLIAGIGFGNLAKKAVEFGMEYKKALDDAAASIIGLHGVTDLTAEGFNQIRAYGSGASDSLDGLSLSAEGSARLLREMTEYAIKTPFDLPGVAKATTLLLSYGKGFGVTGEHVLEYVDIIGNAAAANGKGADAMNNVITVLGKISGQGKVTTRDFNTLTANFPSLHPWETLSELTGKSVEELRKLSLKPGGLAGIADSTDIINALLDSMKELPGAAGAMQRQMMTLNGVFEIFKDTMGVALAVGLEPFFGALIDMMSSGAINDALKVLIASFSLLATTLITSIGPAMPALITAFSDLLLALVPLAPVIGQLAELFTLGLVALTPFITDLVNLTVAAMNFLMALDPKILKAIGAALVLFASPFSGIAIAVAGLALLISHNWDWIKETTLELKDVFLDFFHSDWFAPLVAFAGTIVAVVAAMKVWNAITTVAKALQIAWNVAMAANPIGLIVVAIAAVVAGLVLMYEKVDWFRKAVDALVDWMVDVAWPAIQAAIAATIDWLVNVGWPLLQKVWDGILAGVGAVVDFVVYAWPGVQAVIGAVVDWLVNTAWPILQTVWDGILTGVRAVVDFIVYAWPGVQAAVSAVVDWLVNTAWPMLQTIFGGIGSVISAVVSVIATVVGWVADRIGDVVGVIQDHWSEISGAFSDAKTIIVQVSKFIALVVGAAFDVISDAVAIFMKIWSVTWPIISTVVQVAIGIIVAVIQQVVTVVGWLWSTFGSNIVAVFQNAWNFVLSILGAAITVISGILSFFADLFTGQWGKLWGDVVTIISGIWDAVVAVIQGAIDTVLNIISTLVNGIVGFFTWLWDVLVGHSIIPDMVNAIIGWFQFLWDAAVVIWEGMKAAAELVWNAIKTVITTVVDAIASFLTGAWELIKTAASAAWGFVKSYIINPLQEAWNWVTGTFNAIVSDIAGLWEDIKSAASTAWDFVHDYIVDPLQTAWDWVTGTFSAIVSDLQGYWDTITGAVETAWNSVKDFIINPFTEAWNKVKEISGWITEKISDVTSALADLNPLAHDATLNGTFTPGPSVPGHAGGGIIDRPMLTWVGERSRRETIIPNTMPGRALELMQQTGLDRLVKANQGSGTNFNGPLISMPGAVIQDATDAQVVAQQTVAAMSALMVS